MKLGINQPYFFPYLGYFLLIKHCDQFILLDSVQFIKKGWIHRNRILRPGGDDWQYILVPLKKHKRETLILDIEIKNEDNWQDLILRQLDHYKKHAPFYDETIEFLKEVLEPRFDKIADLNHYLLKRTCNYLGIRSNISIFSKMNLPISQPHVPDEWALNICKTVGADQYFNLPGGIGLFDKDKFQKANISISFIKTNLCPYKQIADRFEPSLSILDVMMFNSKCRISEMLDDFKLL